VNRQALRDLSDKALIDAMRDGAPEAWQEFMMRFRPLLEHYVHRTELDPNDRADAIDSVLEDCAMRWAMDRVEPPNNVTAYLLRAVTYRRKRIARDANRRAGRYELAGDAATIQGAVLSLCSEASVRYSHGPAGFPGEEPRGSLRRFCRLLIEPLSDEDRMILARLGDGLPHREIAAELHMSYEAGRKRIQRLCIRVRDSAPGVLERLNAADRLHVERLLPRTRAAAERRR